LSTAEHNVHVWSFEFVLSEEVTSDQNDILEKIKDILEKILESNIFIKTNGKKITIAVEWNQSHLGNSQILDHQIKKSFAALEID
jgi:predicted ATP-dependent Lon-type protease